MITQLSQWISPSILQPDLTTMNKTAMNILAKTITYNRRLLKLEMEVPFCFLVCFCVLEWNLVMFSSFSNEFCEYLVLEI